MEIHTIFETDEDGEATGIVHTYCSDDCREKNTLPLTEATVYGLSQFDHLCDETVCESCGTPLSQLLNGFDYENQAWVVDGRYVCCGHPANMNCGCFGRIHAGESPAASAEIH